MPLVRHFTATAFVVQDGATLLHWHPKLGMWLPPGGHVEANEDPVQAVLREVEEETGIRAEVVPPPDFADHHAHPVQIPPPLTILIEDIGDPVDGFHQHIDFIYACRPAAPMTSLPDGWRWVTEEELAAGVTLDRPGAAAESPPDDVRLCAAQAFRAVRDHERARA
ncbi:MAG: NUDIX domain-containing protein [Chloroflexota bacterium]|nr:NUDIX domain-containing protein [Chloroflexota bacterium]MDE2884384.1 NUDIX domain-containing protein [Chloroflexota bacterium]